MTDRPLQHPGESNAQRRKRLTLTRTQRSLLRRVVDAEGHGGYETRTGNEDRTSSSLRRRKLVMFHPPGTMATVWPTAEGRKLIRPKLVCTCPDGPYRDFDCPEHGSALG